MSVLQIERAHFLQKTKKKKPHETFSKPVSALGKQSADNQRWRRKGERGERTEERRVEERRGGGEKKRELQLNVS